MHFHSDTGITIVTRVVALFVLVTCLQIHGNNVEPKAEQIMMRSSTEESIGLENHEWRLLQYGTPNNPVEAIGEITIAFGNGKLSGFGGCNRYNASCEVKGNSLSIGSVSATRKYCQQPPGIMNQEREYINVLKSVTSFRIEGKQLILDYDGGSLTFE